MSYEERLDEARREVATAIELIGKKLAGANLIEARKLLADTAEAIKRDDLDAALDLAKRAQLAAKPTTEYLLQKARPLAAQAEAAFNNNSFEEAIDLWKKTLEEYKRAIELSRERGETEVVEKLEQNVEKVSSNIRKAEIAIDNREMVKFVKDGNKAIREAKSFFNSGEFERARLSYQRGLVIFKQALALASKREFKEDGQKVEEAIKSAQASIEMCELASADKVFEQIEEKIASKELQSAEQQASHLLDYLSKLKLSEEMMGKVNDRVREAQKLLIRSKIEQGKEKMREAEALFNKEEFYDAKETFKAAREYLERVSDEVAQYKFAEDLTEVNSFIDACTTNIRIATERLTDIGEVKIEIRTVDEIERGEVEYRPRKPIPPRIRAPTFGFPPELLEEYENPDFCGEGGTSWVYEAVWKKDRTQVAIKIPKTLDRMSAKNFVDEVSIWKELSHPYIAKIYDYNIYPRPYIAMDFFPKSLEDIIDKRIAVDRTLRIMFKVADGLKYAHQKRILHNDIKPSNILLTRDNEPKIADWGLGKILRTSRDSEDVAKGRTELYSAPEQIKNERVDERTDIFQFGIVFYELVTGVNPFQSDSAVGIINKILHEPITPPSQLNPNAKVVEPIIMKCLEREREKRYQTFEDLQSDLANVIGMEYEKAIKVTKSRLEKIQLYCDLIEVYATAERDSANAPIITRYLKDLRENVKSEELRNRINGEVKALEFYAEQKIDIEQRKKRIEEIIYLVRKGG